ncbi:MAG: hypothetical protein KF819_09635 [Labilithrix sp.]|nr:hypothetical protein [Labilithrix sp.]
MSIARTISLFVAVTAALTVGCSSADSDKVMLTGNIGSTSTSTKSFGGVTAETSGLHVVARRVYKQGEVSTGNVDVAVSADGSFRLAVDPEARYVVTIDAPDQKSALVSWGDGKNVLAVQADGAGAQVDVGGVKIVGGEAYPDVPIDGKRGLRTTLAEIDDVFEAVDGAIANAREAADQARKAAERAREAADQARDAAEQAAEDARKAAEEARGAAGR